MRTLDYFVVATYLVAVFAVGIASRGRQDNVDDYFSAHGTFKGRLGAIVIGLSIAASFFSGISFIAYSSFAFSQGVQLIVGVVALPVAWILLRYWFLDRYWSAQNRHPYDIVEKRFGYRARAALSTMFVLMRIGWMAVIIYAPTLIIMGSLGLGQAWFWPIVLTLGGTCTVISVIGGIRAVIVTDAIQFVVICLGLVTVVGSVLVRMHWAVGGIWSDLKSSGHLHAFDFSLSFVAPWTIWAIVIGSIVQNTGSYVSDQMALQRYLASESRSAVFRSFSFNIVGALAVVALLTLVGLLLSVWYLHHPDPTLPANSDLVLPYFSARELPAGISGLLIAAILAATMNTLTSGINSLAGAIINDFLSHLGRPRTPTELFRLARATSVGLGLIATLAAGFASRLGTVLDSSNIMMGAFAGPMFACMLWAVSRAPVRAPAVLGGMALGAVAGCAVAMTPASSFWVAPAGFALAIVIPWLDSVLNRSVTASPAPVA